MQTIISRALAELDIKPLPSRRCFTLMGEGPELLRWCCLVQLFSRVLSWAASSHCFVGDMAGADCPAPAGAFCLQGLLCEMAASPAALQSQATAPWGVVMP